jgi:hypothetical protein
LRQRQLSKDQPMPDRFSSNIPSLTSPATHGFSVTPSDTLDLTEVTRALYVGSGGAVALRLLSGQSVTFAGVAAGSILPVRADRVLATGTTAGSIVGLV